GELEVLTVAGKRVWKSWLGDPLMRMPAVHRGQIYMAYPDTRGDRRHYMICMALDDGRTVWRQPIDGEIITAPVVAGEDLHFATLDGTLWRLRQADGDLVGKEPRNATSSPVVWEDECYFSQRTEVAGRYAPDGETYQTEHLAAWNLAAEELRRYGATARKADYLD